MSSKNCRRLYKIKNAKLEKLKQLKKTKDLNKNFKKL